jgi:hypothetical protein
MLQAGHNFVKSTDLPSLSQTKFCFAQSFGQSEALGTWQVWLGDMKHTLLILFWSNCLRAGS